MYCPAHFEEQRTEVLLDLIERHPLATIVSYGLAGLVANHIPLLHQPGESPHGKLIGHVALGNPLWRAAPDQEHLLVFQGPATYISPNWYATKAKTGKVVPTWNYAVVHAYGKLVATRQPEAILAIINALTNRQEASQGHPWHVADAPKEYTVQLVSNIVGIEFQIVRLLGKWKVSQNQPEENRQSVIDGLRSRQDQAASDMAGLVQKFGAERQE